MQVIFVMKMRTLCSLLFVISLALICSSQDIWSYNPWGDVRWNAWQNWGWIPPPRYHHHQHHHGHKNHYRRISSSDSSEERRDRYKSGRYQGNQYTGNFESSGKYLPDNGPNLPPIGSGVGFPGNFDNRPQFPGSGNMNFPETTRPKIPTPPPIPPPPSNVHGPSGHPTNGNPPPFPGPDNMNFSPTPRLPPIPTPPTIPPPPGNAQGPNGPPITWPDSDGGGVFPPIDLGNKPRGPPASVA